MKHSFFSVTWRDFYLCYDASCGNINFWSYEKDREEVRTDEKNPVRELDTKIVWGGFHMNDTEAEIQCERKCANLN